MESSEAVTHQIAWSGKHNSYPQKMGVTSSGSCEEIALCTNTITVTNALMAIDCG